MVKPPGESGTTEETQNMATRQGILSSAGAGEEYF